MGKATVRTTDDLYEPLPFEEGQVVDGNPVGVCIMVCETPTHSVGIWKCTPGSFKWSYDDAETLYVFRGRATVAVEGSDETVQLEAGTVASFAAGTKVVWTITEEVEKVFCVGE